MSFGLPWVVALGVAVAAGVVALHLLSTQRPPPRPLPTARFVPVSDLRAVSRTSRPTDLLLLALRVLAVLLIAAAFAQPILDAPGPSVRRVVAVEWTTALTDAEAARARAQELLGEGDALVVFDTAARVLPPEALATLAAPTVRRVALSPMLVAVRDAAMTIARGADSLAVTVLSGFPAEAWDDATDVLRAAWPGRIGVLTLEVVADSLVSPLIRLEPADEEDPLAAAIATLNVAAGGGAVPPQRRRGLHPVRVRRGQMTAADSVWVAATEGGVLLQWPRPSDAALAPDGVLAVSGGSAALVAPLARRDLGDATPETSGAHVIVRWRDGTPAATERALGRGCLRDVGIGIPARGDVTLRAPFGALLAVLVEACGGRRSPTQPDSVLTAFAGTGPLAVAAGFEAAGAATALTTWLLVAALVLLLVEQWWRGSHARGRHDAAVALGDGGAR